jgi:hypothetical protein
LMPITTTSAVMARDMSTATMIRPWSFIF